jgi:hypothetical protein
MRTSEQLALQWLRHDASIYVARQLGNSPRIVFKHYARWIESADGGRERAKMDAFLDLAWKKQTAS